MYGRLLTLGQTQTWLKPKVYSCTTPGCCTARTDAGSDNVDQASGFVIKNHQITCSMSYLMQVVGHTVKTWSAVYSMTLDSEFSKGRSPQKGESLIVHGRIELPNTSLQTIDLNSSRSKQAHSNRLGIDHGYENTESGLYSHSTPCFICNSSTARHQTGVQYSVVKYARDRPAVHNVLARHLIFASRLSSVTREDTIFFVLPLNRDKKLAIC